MEEGGSCCQSVKLPESRYSCVDGPMPASALGDPQKCQTAREGFSQRRDDSTLNSGGMSGLNYVSVYTTQAGHRTNN